MEYLILAYNIIQCPLQPLGHFVKPARSRQSRFMYGLAHSLFLFVHVAQEMCAPIALTLVYRDLLLQQVKSVVPSSLKFSPCGKSIILACTDGGIVHMDSFESSSKISTMGVTPQSDTMLEASFSPCSR